MSRIRMHLGVVLVGIGIAGLHLAAQATSVPFWGAHASVSIDTPIEQLRPGEFIWMGDAVSSGPMVMVVSISEQIGKIQIPAEFVSHVNSILEPGATVLITDEPLYSQTNGAALQIADADPPNTGHRS